MIGNGNQVNLLKIDWRKTWNHIKWTYFWPVLAVWNQYASGCSVAVAVCWVQNSCYQYLNSYHEFRFGLWEICVLFILYYWRIWIVKQVGRFLQGGISRTIFAETLPLKQAMDRKNYSLNFRYGQKSFDPLTSQWRHQRPDLFNFASETTVKVIKIAPRQFGHILVDARLNVDQVAYLKSKKNNINWAATRTVFTWNHQKWSLPIHILIMFFRNQKFFKEGSNIKYTQPTS